MDLQFFKNKLLEQQQALLSLKQESFNQTQTVVLDQAAVGRLSRMDAMQKQAMSLEIQRRRQLEMTKIDVALKRIENDEYGYCLSCDDEISVKRLQVSPTATLCIDCAEKREQL